MHTGNKDASLEKHRNQAGVHHLSVFLNLWVISLMVLKWYMESGLEWNGME